MASRTARTWNNGARLLVEAGIAVAGRAVFARCAVAVTYANLAWWTEHLT